MSPIRDCSRSAQFDRQVTWKHDRVEWVGEREHEKIASSNNVMPPPYYPDQPVVREEWARYLNSVSGMDKRFGIVLDKLRAEGRDDDTVIIFFGDNGRLEPRGIHWCYDSGLRVPTISNRTMLSVGSGLIRDWSFSNRNNAILMNTRLYPTAQGYPNVVYTGS